MKTKPITKDKINVITLGCSKNIVDSEVLMGQLKANNFDVKGEDYQGKNSIVIINTCGFIEIAKQESIDTILEFAKAKKEGKIEKLYVTGCLSERYKKALEQEISGVDDYFGVNDLSRILKTLGADYQQNLIGERLTTTPSHYAYLKISEGCDKQCSFCAIPLIRGRHVSRPVEAIIKEAAHLAKQGAKELILIAQDLAYYGMDLYKERKLAGLLNSLSDIKNIEWIRLHYLYPAGLDMKILDVMRTRDNICHYIDIPLQHISDKLLKSMRRGTSKKQTYKLINTIRAQLPDVALRTTLIAGYPDETEADFEELCRFVEETRFDRLGVFCYSHEEGTYAYKLKDNVPNEVKDYRAKRLMELQQDISCQLNQKKIGTTCKVLIDRQEGNYFIGRTEYDSPEVDNEVLIHTKDNKAKTGDFAKVEIIDADKFDLFGKVVSS